MHRGYGDLLISALAKIFSMNFSAIYTKVSGLGKNFIQQNIIREWDYQYPASKGVDNGGPEGVQGELAPPPPPPKDFLLHYMNLIMNSQVYYVHSIRNKPHSVTQLHSGNRSGPKMGVATQSRKSLGKG